MTAVGQPVEAPISERTPVRLGLVIGMVTIVVGGVFTAGIAFATLGVHGSAIQEQGKEIAGLKATLQQQAREATTAANALDVRVSRQEEFTRRVADDVSEIKTDVKTLVRGRR